MKIRYIFPVLFVLFSGCAPQIERLDKSQIYVIDGDTIDIEGRRIRLLGFDTPEIFSPKCSAEKIRGEAAAERLRQLIMDGDKLLLSKQISKDKYGRELANFIIDDTDVSNILIREGLARKYSGQQRLGWCS